MDFLNNPQVQERMMNEYTAMNLSGLVTKGIVNAKTTGEELASRLYAAHHGGVGGAAKLFLEGKDTADKYLTNASVGKSAEKMKTAFAGSASSRPSSDTIASGSVAMADGRMSMVTPQPVVFNAPTTNVQQGNMGGGGSMTIIINCFI